MPSEVMDQRPLSFFSEEIRFPAEVPALWSLN